MDSLYFLAIVIFFFFRPPIVIPRNLKGFPDTSLNSNQSFNERLFSSLLDVVIYISDGWMACDFTSFSTVFLSYQDNGRAIMGLCEMECQSATDKIIASGRTQTLDR